MKIFNCQLIYQFFCLILAGGLHYKTYYSCNYRNKLECATNTHSHPGLIFVERLDPTRVDPLSWESTQVVSLAQNIRLVWKWMAVANILAHYDKATIMTLKSFL